MLPTSFKSDAYDFVTVSAFNSVTGKVDLEEPLLYYHWGADESTADEYDGLDIRGEVLLMTRNIRIVGQDIESWGGQIVTSDTLELDMTERNGRTFMDYVEIYNCSQRDTEKTALRFEGAMGGHSVVSNSAIHTGLGWGVGVFMSANVELKDNFIYKFKPIGVSIMRSSRNITLDGNIAGGIG